MKRKPRSEEEVLDLIRRELPSPGPGVKVGIGDDCALIRKSGKPGSLGLLKTDALVEGIHFSAGTPLHLVGWKALCRPVSDIAAMGGSPLHAMITVAAPPAWGNSQWKALYRGIGKAAEEFGISVVGGETVCSPGPIFLSVVLTGEVPSSRLKLRSGARPGDIVCVTGKLGGSFKSGRHLRFAPRLAEGGWLASQRGVTAMMDLSDGLGSDLPKLARESGCSYRIAPGTIPCHRGCSVEEAISDGEDYELLLTIAPRRWVEIQTRWSKASPALSLTPIGVMISPTETPTLLPPGYDHLASGPGRG